MSIATAQNHRTCTRTRCSKRLFGSAGRYGPELTSSASANRYFASAITACTACAMPTVPSWDAEIRDRSHGQDRHRLSGAISESVTYFHFVDVETADSFAAGTTTFSPRW